MLLCSLISLTETAMDDHDQFSDDGITTCDREMVHDGLYTKLKHPYHHLQRKAHQSLM